ncbi:MAG TPA: DUF169 domain-containing protein [Bryobacteraceae bacterium]|nr:DUF169 domain-containing protein [Bryobacteraceae bacterium]
MNLGLAKPPIAIGFLDDAPAGVDAWAGGPRPAGCSFWREAMNGRSFYTVPSDHYNCAVGSYTHGIEIPPGQGAVLQDTIGFMVGNGYIQMAEVPSIPVLQKTPRFTAYAPVEKATFQPDVVLIAAKPASAMLIYEAALRAGAGDALTHALGRPGCAVLPLSVKSGAAALSFGCKGNRTFTGLPDEELYIAIPGNKWNAVTDAVESILQANATMEAHYQAHAEAFSQ